MLFFFLSWLPKMKNICKLRPVCLIITSDGLFMPVYVWLCLLSYCWLSVYASQKKKQAKMKSQDLNCSAMIYRVPMPVHDLKFNVDTTAYRKDEHQNRNARLQKINLRFMSGRHIFIILLMSAQKCYAPICLNYVCPPFFSILGKFSFPYCLWLYCLCLGPPRTNDERKGNATTNRKRKKVCTIPNKRLVKCSSEMLPIYIYHCRVICKKKKTVNVCICLTPYIISFLTVTIVLDTLLAQKNKDNLELMQVDAYYHFPFTENIVKSVYNKWLFFYRFSFNKENIDYCFTLLACVLLIPAAHLLL
ncbi:uncharacterized protein LOC131533718 isoform X2 [Onychostoma macrolepis]|uniref:uncharacterized protein LOC131533718 isoform X2 n=1 Tax=Onychostoma macrolepis TaxID=369639 RepID=UPI0027295A46|nr:uncharacterized protein LOC131533718 isoform X2 [Onychostoma macrolepis]XP_058622122.1 uncharacterized protein LOC131533718 isoform X2 [Onychostoma macrolepis]